MTTRMRTVRLLPTVVALLLAIGCTSSDTGSSAKPNPLTTIRVTPLGDAPALRLGVRTDAPLVVNVWATWCVPCRKEMPALEATARRYDGSVRFVGINFGDDAKTAQKFVDETGVTFDEYRDPDSTAQAALSITGMPATVFVRADGTVAAVHNGALDEPTLEKLLQKRLRVDPPSGGG
ncbi:MAG: TlpA disulfide reductase family protein [Acidimicrobiales bacterium]